jgi:hypothetical protein
MEEKEYTRQHETVDVFARGQQKAVLRRRTDCFSAVSTCTGFCAAVAVGGGHGWGSSSHGDKDELVIWKLVDDTDQFRRSLLVRDDACFRTTLAEVDKVWALSMSCENHSLGECVTIITVASTSKGLCQWTVVFNCADDDTRRPIVLTASEAVCSESIPSQCLLAYCRHGCEHSLAVVEDFKVVLMDQHFDRIAVLDMGCSVSSNASTLSRIGALQVLTCTFPTSRNNQNNSNKLHDMLSIEILFVLFENGLVQVSSWFELSV